MSDAPGRPRWSCGRLDRLL